MSIPLPHPEPADADPHADADNLVDVGDDPVFSWRHRVLVALGSVAANLPRSLFPARYAWQNEQAAGPGSSAADRWADARRAALLGVSRMPQGPGLWIRTTREGHQEVYRVKDQNGELYATVGCLLGVAVPACSLPGFWDRLG